MRYIVIILVCFFLSCKKNNKVEESSSEKVNLLAQKDSLEIKNIVFNESDYTFVVSLSNNKNYKFEALEMLFDSSTSFKKIDSDSFEFGNGDHYGNHISMFFDFDKNTKILYLKELKAFFPFKQDTLGRAKYCTMDNLNRDIRSIDSEQLLDEFNTDKYCELRKDK
jgi:hypothetical protein